eukprot:m.310854 g.310854  ORF g.310854 m.310854 type:complete len:63 (+) comp55646_c0_seq1:179-367(+)
MRERTATFATVAHRQASTLDNKQINNRDKHSPSARRNIPQAKAKAQHLDVITTVEVPKRGAA